MFPISSLIPFTPVYFTICYLLLPHEAVVVDTEPLGTSQQKEGLAPKLEEGWKGESEEIGISHPRGPKFNT